MKPWISRGYEPVPDPTISFRKTADVNTCLIREIRKKPLSPSYDLPGSVMMAIVFVHLNVVCHFLKLAALNSDLTQWPSCYVLVLPHTPALFNPQPPAHQTLAVCQPRKPEACPYLPAVPQPGLLSDCQSPLTGYWRDMRWHTSMKRARQRERRRKEGGDKKVSGKKERNSTIASPILIYVIAENKQVIVLVFPICHHLYLSPSEGTCTPSSWRGKKMGKRLCSELNVESDPFTPQTALSLT